MPETAASIFEPLEPGTWRATEWARGPFNGVHGGSVAGLLATAMQEVLPGHVPLSFRADFLRPTPVGVPLSLRVETVQAGRRVAVMDASLEAEGRVTARASLVLAAEVPVPGLTADFLTELPPEAPDLSSLPRRTSRAAHGGRWVMDAMDARLAPDGSVWFRWLAPFLAGAAASPLVAALGPADFAHGLARPGLPGPPPVAAYPNTDLSVQLDRVPRGEWVGVRPFTRWRRNGVGIGYGDLLDLEGAFGRVSMGVVLVAA